MYMICIYNPIFMSICIEHAFFCVFSYKQILNIPTYDKIRLKPK